MIITIMKEIEANFSSFKSHFQILDNEKLKLSISLKCGPNFNLLRYQNHEQ